MREETIQIALTPVNMAMIVDFANIIDNARRVRSNQTFFEDVDPVQQGLLGYDEVIRRRLSFNQIKRDLFSKQYLVVYEFLADIAQMYQNCILFNTQLGNNDLAQQAQHGREYTNELLTNYLCISQDDLQSILTFDFAQIDMDDIFDQDELRSMSLVQYLNRTQQESLWQLFDPLRIHYQDIKIINLLCMQMFRQVPQ